MATQSRDSVVQELRSLKRGVEKYLTGDTLTLEGRVYSASDLVAALDEVIDAALAVTSANGALLGALAHEREVRADAVGVLQALRLTVRLKYKHAPPVLADFALEPKKSRTPPTAEQRLVMAAKNRATRKKRGTLGKRQKKAIRGKVTGVVITPIVKGEEPGKEE